MNIAIVSALWGRRTLTDIFLQSLRRYRQDYGFNAVVAGSEGDITKNMCAAYGVGYIEMPNLPVSNKFIKAAKLAITLHNPQYLLILGSDDFMDHSLISEYLSLAEEKYDLIGLINCYFYNSVSGEAARWRGYTNFRKGETVGMGRMLSKKVYERLGRKLWASNMNSGLDYGMMQKIKKIPELKQKAIRVEDHGIAVDVKVGKGSGDGNITGFDAYRPNLDPVDISVFNTIPEFSKIMKL